MTDNFSSSLDDVDTNQTLKCAQDLSMYIDSKFPIEPPSLEAILNDYPYLTKLGNLTMNLLRTLINNGLTDESFGKIDFAIRTMIFEKCNLDVSNLKSQISLNSIKSMTNSSLSSASSSPFTIKTETAQEIRRLSEELQNTQKREIQLEEEIKSQKSVIKRIEDENLKLSSQLSNKKDQSNEQYCNMQIEIMNLKDEIDRQKENVSFSEDRAKRLNEVINELNQDKEELDKKIVELKVVIQTKKEKISTLKLNEKKLKYELQNERLNSAKLQTELDMQLKLQSGKEGQSKQSQSLDELVNQYQKMLNERDIDNAFLSQKLTTISNYAKQLVNISEELEDRLSMAEEDKSVNLALISELQGKLNVLTEENCQKQNELFSLQNELQDIKDQISKFEKETGISINSDDIQAAIQSRSSNLANNMFKPKQLIELEGIASSLLRYIDILMFGEGDLYPLICRSEPILQNEEIRKSIISSIQDLKVTLSLLNISQDTSEFLDKILTDSEGIQGLIDELRSKEEYTEYAAISVLCSANNNIRRFLEETAESLTQLHQLLPTEYRESDIVLSLKKYVTDSHKIYALLFEAINNQNLFRSDEIKIQPMMEKFIKEVNELLHGLDVEVKPTLGYRVKMTEMPNDIASYIEDQERQIESLKSNGNESTLVNTLDNDSLSLKSRDIQLDSHITQLENEKSTLLQKIDDQNKDYLEQIEELKRMLSEETSKLKLAEQNLELTQKGAAEALMKAKIVEKERDDLLELSNKRKKLFSQRKKAIIENERLNYEDQLRRERKKFENEKLAIVQALEAKNSRYKSLKRRYAEMEAMYEKQSSHQSSKIVDLINNLRVLGERATQQADEREKRHKTEIERLEEKVARILSMANNKIDKNNDDDAEMMDNSLIETEKAPKNQVNAPSSIYMTPNKNGIDNLNISENIIDNLNNSGSNSARLSGNRSSECDRFVAQVGRALSKYTNDEGPWTRSRILASLQRICSRLSDIEKGNNNYRNIEIPIPAATQINNYRNNETPQTPSALTPTFYRNRRMSMEINSSKTTPIRPSLNNTEIEGSLIFMNSPAPRISKNNDISSNTNNDNLNTSTSKQPLKIAAAINEQREWQSWAMDIALRMNIPPCSPSELRVELKDIFYGTNAKSQLVRMITSLREQKKFFKIYPLQILSHENSENPESLDKKNLKFKPLVLLLRFILIERRLVSKAALNQQHMKQQTKGSSRYSLPLSPRTVQTQL